MGAATIHGREKWVQLRRRTKNFDFVDNMWKTRQRRIKKASPAFSASGSLVVAIEMFLGVCDQKMETFSGSAFLGVLGTP